MPADGWQFVSTHLVRDLERWSSRDSFGATTVPLTRRTLTNANRRLLLAMGTYFLLDEEANGLAAFP